jgi:hypothetical protein
MIAVRASARGLADSPRRRALLVDYLTAFVGAQRLADASPALPARVAAALAALVGEAAGAEAPVAVDVHHLGTALRLELRLGDGAARDAVVALGEG